MSFFSIITIFSPRFINSNIKMLFRFDNLSVSRIKHTITIFYSFVNPFVTILKISVCPFVMSKLRCIIIIYLFIDSIKTIIGNINRTYNIILKIPIVILLIEFNKCQYLQYLVDNSSFICFFIRWRSLS